MSRRRKHRILRPLRPRKKDPNALCAVSHLVVSRHCLIVGRLVRPLHRIKMMETHLACRIYGAPGVRGSFHSPGALQILTRKLVSLFSMLHWLAPSLSACMPFRAGEVPLRDRRLTSLDCLPFAERLLPPSGCCAGFGDVFWFLGFPVPIMRNVLLCRERARCITAVRSKHRCMLERLLWFTGLHGASCPEMLCSK